MLNVYQNFMTYFHRMPFQPQAATTPVHFFFSLSVSLIWDCWCVPHGFLTHYQFYNIMVVSKLWEIQRFSFAIQISQLKFMQFGPRTGLFPELFHDAWILICSKFCVESWFIVEHQISPFDITTAILDTSVVCVLPTITLHVYVLSIALWYRVKVDYTHIFIELELRPGNLERCFPMPHYRVGGRCCAITVLSHSFIQSANHGEQKVCNIALLDVYFWKGEDLF